tara:strand:+ start:3999 stop:4517 length:519 start_codon:yes stop_codon:yes gene_type:complete
MFAPTYFAAQRLSLRVHRASRARSLARKIARQAVANKAAADAMHEAAAEDQRYLSVLYAKLMAGHRVYHRNGKVTLEVRSRDFKVKCQIIADPSKPYFTFILTEERKRQKSVFQTTHVGASYSDGAHTVNKLLRPQEVTIWPKKRGKAMIIKVTELTALRVLRFVEEFSGKK